MADGRSGGGGGVIDRIPSDQARGHTELFSMLTVAFRRRRLLIALPVAGALLALLTFAIVGQRYSADSTIKPQAADTPQGRLSGLAAQLGFMLPGASMGDPVRLYTELTQSRELLTAVVQTRYLVRTGDAPGDTASGNLVHWFDVSGRTPEVRLRKALDKLRERVIVTATRDAGLVSIRTISGSPDLSVQINRRILDLLNDVNLRRRQSQAAAEREFVEKRVEEARTELERAEGAERAFQERNRDYRSSPELRMESARLERRVRFRGEIYLQLAQLYEQARIEEVRNTPSMAIIDRPEGSARPYGSLAKDVAVGVLVGLVLAIVLVIGLERVGASRASNGQDYDAFRDEVRSVLKPFRRRRSQSN